MADTYNALVLITDDQGKKVYEYAETVDAADIDARIAEDQAKEDAAKEKLRSSKISTS